MTPNRSEIMPLATLFRAFVLIGLLLSLAPGAAQTLDQYDRDGPTQEIPGRYIAVYRGNSAFAARAAERAGGEVVFNHAGAGILFIESAPHDFAARLEAGSSISNVVSDRWITNDMPDPKVIATMTAGIAATGISNSTSPFGALLLPNQWNIFQTQTDSAWALTLGNPSVKVAIVDTGICAHHVDLAGKVNASLSRSFVAAADEVPETAEPSCIGCPVWEDRHGHGTWVASVVSTNNWGMAGVAPNVELVAIKVANHDDRGAITTLIRGILYAADAGVDVINVSRGYPITPIRDFPQGMALLQRTLAYATRQGSLLVFGAGNNAIDLDHAGNAIAVPCETTNGMCIGATTVSDALASYSNHGVSAVTMVAPGGGVPTAPLPDTALNVGVIAACDVHAIQGACGTGVYQLVLGTSFAAPMVSGAAALVLSKHPNLRGKPQQLKTVLVNSADDLGEPGADSLFSKGRLNTLRAVR